ncbi:hypothetical protein [Segatella bryantii]|uniref:hypothetical protein n=1 Tax=Segatella bryantii TaxID=77095 RepID=UPI00242F4CAF|nr:hypothetical protein [Segatella bryantii]
MKKSLLFATLLAASLTANAQVEWTMVSAKEAVTVPDAIITSAGIQAKAPVLGKGLSYNGVDVAHKDKTGNNVNWIGDGSTGYIKIQPTNAQVAGADSKMVTPDANRNLASAASDEEAMYIDFYAETVNPKDLLDVKSIEFDATKIGTDGAMVNAAVFYNEDPQSGATTWLITPENADAVDGEGGGTNAKGTGGHWNGVTDETWATTNDAGYRPDRNDGTKSLNGENCVTHFTIPITNVPEDAYGITVRVYVYGISSNKQMLIHNVKINGVVTGISTVKAEAAAKDAPTYNLAGQKVSKDFKGVVIKNGKKSILK